MDKLVQTDFFQAISEDKAYDIENTYTEFIYKIMELCYNTTVTYGSLIFTLSNTEIELITIKEGQDRNSSVLTQMFVSKAIRFIETAKRFVSEHKSEYLPKPTTASVLSFNHKWTTKPIYLTEMIYALQSYRCIDNGDVTIEDLSSLFGQIFNIDLKNINLSYNDIKKRNGDSRTYFLDELSERLNRRMDSDDEKKNNRR